MSPSSSLDRVAYCVWCNDAGHLIDDGTLFRFGEREYRLCTAERQIDWLLDSAIGFDVRSARVTEQIAALAVQGPTSCAVLKALGPARHGEAQTVRNRLLRAWADSALMVSRTGFTGDLGYELWMEPQDAEAVWDALMEAGRTRGIRAIGSQALNVARIEAGFLLPNVDFVSAEHTIRTGRDRSPAGVRPELAGRLREGTFQRAARPARGASARACAASSWGWISPATSRPTMP